MPEETTNPKHFEGRTAEAAAKQALINEGLAASAFKGATSQGAAPETVSLQQAINAAQQIAAQAAVATAQTSGAGEAASASNTQSSDSSS